MQTIVKVNQLTHHYGQRQALKDLSFEAYPGEIFGLLGPNGAGKTTTIRLLNGMFLPTSGQIEVLGLNPAQQGSQVRRLTGVLTETPALYERLSAVQNLEFFATLSGMSKDQQKKRISELLEIFEFGKRANDRVGTFSKGMKQRLALARSLLNDPALLFLDEPTSGLDPEASAQVRDLVEQIGRKNGSTVFLCTHLLNEAQRLCDRVAILNQGQLIALGTLDELRRKIAPGIWVDVELWDAPTADWMAKLSGINGVTQVKIKDHQYRVQVAEKAVIPQLAETIIHNHGKIVSLQPQEISLEEIYFTMQNGVQEGQS